MYWYTDWQISLGTLPSPVDTAIRIVLRTQRNSVLRETSKWLASQPLGQPHSGILTGTGHILADAVYTLPEIKSRLGLGASAMRSARRLGTGRAPDRTLRIRVGRDVMQFIVEAGPSPPTRNGPACQDKVRSR